MLLLVIVYSDLEFEAVDLIIIFIFGVPTLIF